MKKRHVAIAFFAGLLPILAVFGAFLININAPGGIDPRFVCNPYLEGCVSISRAARSGPGLYLFRALMLPCVVVLLLCWHAVRSWLLARSACSPQRARIIFLLGAAGALFLVFYVTALGSEGEWYKWLRRYGVTIFFGGTALAQLLLVASLWPSRNVQVPGALKRPIRLLMALVSLQWVAGVLSVVKRLVLSDPDLIDRMENIIEWWFALPMALAFIAIAWLFARSRASDSPG